MAFALLLALLTVLAVVGAWAGLQAWPKSKLAATGIDRVPALPAPLPAPVHGPLAKVRSTIEAGFARPTVRPTSALDVTIDLAADAGPLVLTVLDGTTHSPLHAVEIATLAAAGASRHVTLDAIAGVPLRLVVHEKGRSPNFAWLARMDVAEPQIGATSRSAHLSVVRQSVVLRLHATQLDDGRRFVPITTRITRTDDDAWGNSMTLPVAIAFEPGSSDHDLELPALPAGSYRLSLDGFALESGEPLTFSVPGPARIEARGVPR